jgi:nucleoside-diphosphate-sugar epimerase
VRAFAGRTGQLIFCSTVDVYTKPATRSPYSEAEPLSGVSLYGKRKVACERVFTAAHGSGSLPVTIIRPAYTYGEGQSLLSWRGRDNYLIDRLRKGKPVIAHGDGTSLWVCAHIDDVGLAFANAVGNMRAFGRSYHATGEEWMTWDQYYQAIAGVLGAPKAQLVHIPSDLLAAVAPKSGRTPVENFMFSNVFDNSAAHADLGYRYTISWQQGVARVVPWLESRGLIKNSDENTLDDAIIAAWRRLSDGMVEELKGLDA